jgi:hypothetical protein
LYFGNSAVNRGTKVRKKFVQPNRSYLEGLFVAKKINPYICEAQQKGNLVRFEDSTRCCDAYPARGYLSQATAIWWEGKRFKS